MNKYNKFQYCLQFEDVLKTASQSEDLKRKSLSALTSTVSSSSSSSTTTTAKSTKLPLATGQWRGLKVKHDKRLAQWFDVINSRHFHPDIQEVMLKVAPLNEGENTYIIYI
jgi:hypothetical protein